MCDEWNARALAQAQAGKATLAASWPRVSLSCYLSEMDKLNRVIGQLERGILPERRRRRMPSLMKIATHYGIDNDAPRCWRCGVQRHNDASWRNANEWLERAHVIDRCGDGLDDVQNIRPLCPPCHSSQPAFQNGDEALALAWFGEWPRSGPDAKKAAAVTRRLSGVQSAGDRKNGPHDA